MNKLLEIYLLLFISFSALAQRSLVLKSPSEKLTTEIQVDTDRITLNLSSSGKHLINVQTLRFSLEDIKLEGKWLLHDFKSEKHTNIWNPLFGENQTIHDNYNELILSLESPINQKQMMFFVRLYDEGMAFRYSFDKLDFWNSTLNEEKTSFIFPFDCNAWESNMAQSSIFQTRLSQLKGEVERPLVIQISSEQYAAIGEASLVDYSRMKLKKGTQPNSVESVLSGEVNLNLAGYITPWRYVMIGKTPGELVENNYFLLNLNEPNKIQNADWIKPGQVLREVTLTTEGGLACIDFAAENNIQYIEYDAGWYGPENNPSSDASKVSVDPARSKGNLDLQKVIDYANQKNVGVILYVNKYALHNQLDEILPLYKKWGVKGVKFGFVDVGDQYSTSWLHQAIRKAAKYKLMVDVHDEYRPTGYSRTYPNLITQEGIRGDEESPSVEQTINTLYTRMISGAGDYTNCFFADRVSDKMGGKAAQLAKRVAIYSPWQFIFWYDRPYSTSSKTGGAGASESKIKVDKVTKFYCSIPTVWSETKFVDGEIGKYAVVARRSESDWYIGVLNSDVKRKIVLPLDKIIHDWSKQYFLYLYSQAPGKSKRDVKIEKIILGNKRTWTLNVDADSGCVLYITSAIK